MFYHVKKGFKIHHPRTRLPFQSWPKMIMWFNISFAIRLVPNTIETKSYTWKHAHKSRKFTYKPKESKYINTLNTRMFFMCVPKSQNMKNEIPKPHHGNKSPQTQKKPYSNLIGLQSQITNYMKLISCNKYLIIIMCYKGSPQHIWN